MWDRFAVSNKINRIWEVLSYEVFVEDKRYYLITFYTVVDIVVHIFSVKRLSFNDLWQSQTFILYYNLNKFKVKNITFKIINLKFPVIFANR